MHSVTNIRLPKDYNYLNSLNFVFIDNLATPELWMESHKAFLFLYGNIPILLKFDKEEMRVTSLEHGLPLCEIVRRKLNLVPESLETYREGIQFFRDRGLIEYVNYLEGFIPPVLGDGPRWLYTGLIKTILLQFVSYRVARLMINRFIRTFGDRVEFQGYQTWSFPEPERILAIPLEELKQSSQISRMKALAIKSVAEMERDGILASLEKETQRDPDAVAQELMKVKGIGYWTAYVALMAGLGVWHAQPLDSLEKSLKSRGINPEGLRGLSPRAWGYISVALLFVEEAKRGRYFRHKKLT